MRTCNEKVNSRRCLSYFFGFIFRFYILNLIFKFKSSLTIEYDYKLKDLKHVLKFFFKDGDFKTLARRFSFFDFHIISASDYV